MRFGVTLAFTLLRAAEGAGAQQLPPTTSPAPAATAPSAQQPGIEADAVAILKAMSEKLAAAKTISFIAVNAYESPAVNGQPLYYTTVSQVMVERPDKLRVVTPGDGPPTEFYYNGKTQTRSYPDDGPLLRGQGPTSRMVGDRRPYPNGPDYPTI
jgi:hypothetical protein